MTKRYAVQDYLIDSLIDRMLDKETVFKQAQQVNILLDEALEGLDIYRDEIARLEAEIETLKNNSAVALGKLGGSVTSEKKKISSSENGKLGGRPKKIHFDIFRLAGRRTSGASLDAGKLYHAVIGQTAVCGKKPGKTSDWSAYPGTVVTCPRCLKKISDLV